MNHVKRECEDPECDGAHCNTCNLFICKICDCAEGTLPTECPGVKVTGGTQDDIYRGKIDYVDGGWRRPKRK